MFSLESKNIVYGERLLQIVQWKLILNGHAEFTSVLIDFIRVLQEMTLPLITINDIGKIFSRLTVYIFSFN